jgi:F-type H+-transporting ATPase subunit alpha
MAMNKMVPLLYAGINSLINRILIGQIQRWKANILTHFKNYKAKVLAQIKKDGKLSHDLEARIKDITIAFNTAIL